MFLPWPLKILINKKIEKKKYKDVIIGLGTLKLYRFEKTSKWIKEEILSVEKIIGAYWINVKINTDNKIEKLLDRFNSLKILNRIIKKILNDKNSIIKKVKLLKKK